MNDRHQSTDDQLFDLLFAITLCRDISTIAVFLQDILTESELNRISRRMRIAKLLLQQKTYSEIVDQLGVGEATVAKVAAWLEAKGEGIRKIIHTLPTDKESIDPLMISEWKKVQQKYPTYFLLDRIINAHESHNRKKRNTIVTTLKTNLKQKTKIHKQIDNK